MTPQTCAQGLALISAVHSISAVLQVSDFSLNPVLRSVAGSKLGIAGSPVWMPAAESALTARALLSDGNGGVFPARVGAFRPFPRS